MKGQTHCPQRIDTIATQNSQEKKPQRCETFVEGVPRNQKAL